MADDVWRWCANAKAFGRTVTVKIKFGDFRQITRSRSHPGAVADHAALRQASLELIRSIYPPETGIRLVGVTVSNFDAPSREGHDALPLFGCTTRATAASSVMAEANR